MAFGVHPSFRGLAREVGLTPRTVEVGTDPLDEPKRVAEAVRTALGSEEFLVVCLEGALLASRLGDVAGKVAYLEAVDRELIRPLSERVLSGGGRLLLTASHAVSVEERRDTRDVVPFLLCGEGTARYGDAAFTEAAALASDLVVDRGSTLLEFARRG
jgi:2,3-bisphosphoglycerate-independent phosphoglycerate mutase